MSQIQVQVRRLAERQLGHIGPKVEQFLNLLSQNSMLREPLYEEAIEAYCDGGCLNQGNGKIGDMYYSYRAEMPYRTLVTNRARRGTFQGAADNNIAELLAARELLHAIINRVPWLPRNARIVIHTDSQVLLGLVEGAYATQSAQMDTLARQIRSMVRMMASQEIWVNFHWCGRERLVEVLGH